jgi:hypothetical protein
MMDEDDDDDDLVRQDLAHFVATWCFSRVVQLCVIPLDCTYISFMMDTSCQFLFICYDESKREDDKQALSSAHRLLGRAINLRILSSNETALYLHGVPYRNGMYIGNTQHLNVNK